VYPDNPKGRWAQVKALILLLRYSGLRIRDAITLRRGAILEGKLYLYTGKTGTGMYIPLPEVVLESLKGIGNEEYFFWTGEGKVKSVLGSWERSLTTLFKLAGVKGHAHQFRDNFAVDLLTHGVSVENVAMLLGHSDIRVTQKHYAPWVQSRQVELEKAVKLTWG
jgi:integrase